MKNLFVRKGGKYVAESSFDGVRITTGACLNLSTAVEFLMVLTSIKQKMQCAGAQGFQERLREAVVSACDEHGKTVLEMSLRFSLHISAVSFTGNGYTLTLGEEHVVEGGADDVSTH